MPHMSPRIASSSCTGAGAGGRGRGGRGQRDMGLIGELFDLCLYRVFVEITKVK